MLNVNYKIKYLKYKNKYLNYKNKLYVGGMMEPSPQPPPQPPPRPPPPPPPPKVGDFDYDLFYIDKESTSIQFECAPDYILSFREFKNEIVDKIPTIEKNRFVMHNNEKIYIPFFDKNEFVLTLGNCKALLLEAFTHKVLTHNNACNSKNVYIRVFKNQIAQISTFSDEGVMTTLYDYTDDEPTNKKNLRNFISFKKHMIKCLDESGEYNFQLTVWYMNDNFTQCTSGHSMFVSVSKKMIMTKSLSEDLEGKPVMSTKLKEKLFASIYTYKDSKFHYTPQVETDGKMESDSDEEHVDDIYYIGTAIILNKLITYIMRGDIAPTDIMSDYVCKIQQRFSNLSHEDLLQCFKKDIITCIDTLPEDDPKHDKCLYAQVYLNFPNLEDKKAWFIKQMMNNIRNSCGIISLIYKWFYIINDQLLDKDIIRQYFDQLDTCSLVKLILYYQANINNIMKKIHNELDASKDNEKFKSIFKKNIEFDDKPWEHGPEAKCTISTVLPFVFKS